HQRRHDGQPRVADLAEALAQALDALVELGGEPRQMRFLAVLAGKPELAAMDGDGHLRHHTALALARVSTRTPRARSGYPRWQYRAGARSRGWWFPAPSCARRRRRARRRAANGHRRAHA